MPAENDWEHLAKIGSDGPGGPYGRNPDDFLIHYFHTGVDAGQRGDWHGHDLMQHPAFRAGLKHHLSGGGEISDHEILKKTHETDELMRVLAAERARAVEKRQRTEGKSFNRFVDELVEAASGDGYMDTMISQWEHDTRSFASSNVARSLHDSAVKKVHSHGFRPDDWPDVHGIEENFHTQPSSYEQEGEHRSNIVVYHDNSDPLFWMKAQTHVRNITGQTHTYNKKVSEPGFAVFTLKHRA